MKNTFEAADRDEVKKSCKKLCAIYHEVLEELTDGEMKTERSACFTGRRDMQESDKIVTERLEKPEQDI